MSQWKEPPGDPYGQTRAYGQQPAYGPPAGPPPGRPSRGPFPPQSADSFGIVGTVMALLGGIAILVAFTALDWFSTSGGNLGFGDVDNPPKGFAAAYFGWLAWLFLIVVVIAGVLSSVPSPAMRIFRIVGIVVGIAAAGLSFLAIQLSDSLPYTTFLKDARVGFYLAVVGFVVAGVGAAIGPRHV